VQELVHLYGSQQERNLLSAQKEVLDGEGVSKVQRNPPEITTRVFQNVQKNYSQPSQ